MQEFGGFTSPVDRRSFDERVSEIAQTVIDSQQPEVVVSLVAVEALLTTLIVNAIASDAALLDATKLSTEKLEILIREAVERNLQLRLQTGEEIDSVDVDLEMGERQ